MLTGCDMDIARAGSLSVRAHPSAKSDMDEVL